MFEVFKYTKESWSCSEFPNLDSDQSVLFVFGAPSFFDNQKPFADLRKHYPNSIIFGCSSAGEIHESHIEDESLSVAVAKFEHTQVKTAYADVSDASQSFVAGEKIAAQLKSDDLKGVLLLSDGLNINGSELIKGVNSVCHGVVMTGGLAGDGPNFKKTWVLQKDRPQTNVVAAIGLYGDRIQINHGSKGGWHIFGPKRLITKSEGNVLFELDGEPALDLYKKYLGEKAKDLPASALFFPLQIVSPNAQDKSIVRAILAVDEEKNSMTFAGDLPQGYYAQLMRADINHLINGAADAAEALQTDTPSLAISISCVGRRLVLGEQAEEEVEAVLEHLAEGSAQVGFYSYGELSPRSTGEPCQLHNQTMTITTLSEAS